MTGPAVGGGRTSGWVAVVLAPALVLVVHLVLALATHAARGPVALGAPVVAALLVQRCARLLGLAPAEGSAAALVGLAGPLSVVGAESPGAGVLGLLVAAAAAAWAVPLRARSSAALVRGCALVLGAVPLLAGAWAAVGGPLAGGWGSGTRSVDGGPRALSGWASVDPALPWVAAAAVVLLLALPGRRLLGAAGAAVAVVVVVADLPAASLVAALPLTGLVTASAVDELLGRGAALVRRRRAEGPGARAAGRATAVVAVALALVPAWWAVATDPPSAGAGTAGAAATRWIAHQVPSGQLVAVDAGLRRRLADDAQPVAALVALPGAGGAPARAGRVGWLLERTSSASAPPGSWVARARERSQVAAAFGSGTQRLAVRQLTAAGTGGSGAGSGSGGAAVPSAVPSVVPSAVPSAIPSATPTIGGAAPLAAALQLAGNPHLRLSSAARTQLTGQPVDERVVALLAQVLASTDLSVDQFPTTAGDPATTPRRAVEVDAIGGVPVAQAGAAVTSLQVVLAAQPAEYRATSTLVGSGAGQRLLITLPPSSP